MHVARFRWLFVVALTTPLFCLASASAAEFGIEKRVPWTTSRLVGSPEPPRPYVNERVFPELSFKEPVELAVVPGTSRLAVVEVGGKIYTFENKPSAANADRDLMLDVATLGKQFSRAYGLAFHPKFTENRTLFLSYVTKNDDPAGSRVSRFKLASLDPPRIDPKSEEVIITWMGGGHNGAHIQFGPDGLLYISTGDGGSSFPPDGRNTGQDVTDLLASVLRIDVDARDGDKQYRIPKDNPFVSLSGARGEVWCFGLRNPWKMCFDPADGSLWVADVGWEMWEMIYRVARGGNYGWSLVEASQPVHTERTRGPTPILPPTLAHDHTESRSITGGYFSQSSRLPELKGAYIYGDYVTGIVWALRHDGDKITWRETLVDTPLQIVTFGLDQSGDVLMVDYAGTIHRLVPNPRKSANTEFPKRLSETGLFASTKEHSPAPGVIPYTINAEPWADGATAERLVALPGTSQLDLWDKTDVQLGMIAGEWKYPDGAVLAKTMSLELEPGNPKSRRRIETQVLHYDLDTWRGYNYLWNDEQTDAVLAGVDGSDTPFKIRDKEAPGGERQQTWHHAGRTECIVCHTTRAGSIHGFRIPQLSRTHDYAGKKADQLATLEHIGFFAKPPAKNVTPFCDPLDEKAPLEQRARTYLHVNCAHCHRRGGGGSAAFDAQVTTPLDKANLIGERPTQGTFNIYRAAIVARGKPYESVLFYRMMKLGSGRMPQFGSRYVDDQGADLVRDWITSLDKTSPPSLRITDVSDLTQFDTPRFPLRTTSEALAYADSTRYPAIESRIRDRMAAEGLKSPDPLVRDLFERYIPEEKRIKRLGTTIKPAALLALTGDVERGRKLFTEHATVQCRNCHKVGEVGRNVGPDLTAIGKKLDRPKLLESLLEPSKTIDPQFVTQLIETTDGEVVTGLLVTRDANQVVLRLADGKERSVAADKIDLITAQQKSLMPELLLQDLTAAQVADLLAYLSSLK
jgi:putative heme-binding domain-containing protein